MMKGKMFLQHWTNHLCVNLYSTLKGVGVYTSGQPSRYSHVYTVHVVKILLHSTCKFSVFEIIYLLLTS